MMRPGYRVCCPSEQCLRWLYLGKRGSLAHLTKVLSEMKIDRAWSHRVLSTCSQVQVNGQEEVEVL